MDAPLLTITTIQVITTIKSGDKRNERLNSFDNNEMNTISQRNSLDWSKCSQARQKSLLQTLLW